MAEQVVEGVRTDEGGWQPNVGSKHRRLNAAEVADLEKMANTVVPSFEWPHNAPWEDHHPIAREIWQKRLTPAQIEEAHAATAKHEKAKAAQAKIDALKKQIADAQNELN